jgi:hypothetical protein
MASILSATVRQIVTVVARFVKWSEGRYVLHGLQTPSTGYVRVLIFYNGAATRALVSVVEPT